jgi:hypothetical protein
MKLKTIEQFIEYINNNKLTEAQESYIRSTIAWDQDSYDEIKNEPN